MSAWTPEAEALLRTMKAQGYSSEKIARFLRNAGVDVTRSAVIGKCTRLGLCDADKTPPRQEAQRRSIRRRTAGNSKVVSKDSKTPIRFPNAEPYRERGAPRGSSSVPFIVRATNQCPMFVEGESGATGFVCGEPATHGAWCERCAGLVYTGRVAAELVAA